MRKRQRKIFAIVKTKHNHAIGIWISSASVSEPNEVVVVEGQEVVVTLNLAGPDIPGLLHRGDNLLTDIQPRNAMLISMSLQATAEAVRQVVDAPSQDR